MVVAEVAEEVAEEMKDVLEAEVADAMTNQEEIDDLVIEATEGLATVVVIDAHLAVETEVTEDVLVILEMTEAKDDTTILEETDDRNLVVLVLKDQDALGAEISL